MRCSQLAVALGAICAVSVCAQTPGAGIQPLTSASFEAAKIAATRANAGLNSPLAIRMDAIRATYGGPMRRDARGQMVRPTPPYALPTDGGGSNATRPFIFHIVTPYSTVVDTVAEATRKFSEPKFPSLESLNAGLVIVAVGPGESITAADTIENVVIKRAGQIVKPVKATVTPITIETRMGAKQESANGFFTFDYSAFAPDTTITIVLVGKTGNMEWTMPPEELKQLK